MTHRSPCLPPPAPTACHLPLSLFALFQLSPFVTSAHPVCHLQLSLSVCHIPFTCLSSTTLPFCHLPLFLFATPTHPVCHLPLPLVCHLPLSLFDTPTHPICHAQACGVLRFSLVLPVHVCELQKARHDGHITDVSLVYTRLQEQH